MTLSIVVALTVYAIATPTDFTMMGGFLIVLVMSLIMLGIFSLIAWSPFLDNLYCCLGIFVAGLYLVYDTQMIVGGRRLSISIDDYVIGALMLYLDIIQIFLYLLELFSRKWSSPDYLLLQMHLLFLLKINPPWCQSSNQTTLCVGGAFLNPLFHRFWYWE